MCVFSAQVGTAKDVTGCAIFGTALILLYTFSMLYHVFTNFRAKRVFQILDHCGIFLLIAGSYTPCVLMLLPPKIGWTIFGLQWGFAVAGILFCKPGTELAVVCGKAQPILTGERCALNFMQRLSGIATMTRQYVLALGDSKTKLLDTRKTTPGLRMLEKYAVKVGGAQNHRFGLFDRIMIKDNHREMAKSVGEGSIAWAVRQCREKYPKLEIEIEADNLDEVRQAADAGVEYILLDNMSNEMMVEAIKIIAGRAKTEASGNITLERLPSLRNLGLDFISSGALTHSVRSIDIGLDILN